jgi:pilus assembly protein CpaC
MLIRLLPLLLILLSLVAQPASAQTQPNRIRVEMSGGELIELPRPAANVFIADSTIADVQAPSGNSIFVFGKKPGTTMLFALDANGKQIMRTQVVVSYNVSELGNILRQEVPDATVSVTSTPSGIVLTGVVPNAEAAEKVRAAAARHLNDKDELVNQLQVTGPQQVNLRVRVAEVSRQVTKQLGFNWESVVAPGSFAFGLATGRPAFLAGGAQLNSPGGLNINNLLTRAAPLTQGAALPGSFFGNLQTNRASVNSLIDALAEEGLVTVLAEPNLTAITGQSASFLAGGEFPIPVAQSGANNAITIEFKQFGVSLDFVPTVLANNLISIKVRPEVSELSQQGAITLNNITVPAITVRRAETTVELGSGDSFAIAGLLQDSVTQNVSALPFLGELPVLGALFRSDSFQRNETELVIIVTPFIVRPTRDPAALHRPDENYVPPTDLERILLLRQVGQTTPVQPMRIPGAAGFIVQ